VGVGSISLYKSAFSKTLVTSSDGSTIFNVGRRAAAMKRFSPTKKLNVLIAFSLKIVKTLYYSDCIFS